MSEFEDFYARAALILSVLFWGSIIAAIATYAYCTY